MSDRVVYAETADGIARVYLNRPEKRNALNAAMVSELHAILGTLDADPGARVVAIRGNGADFCAGADLGEVAKTQEQGADVGLADAQRLGEVFVRIRRLTKPVVAVVTGRALAGGCGLASACDLVLAHEDAHFGYPEVRLGFVPAMVMAILRRKLGESAAFELVVGGHRIDAATAASIGLVNQLIPDDAFQPAVHEYLSDLASRPPTAVALTKRLLYGLDGTGFDEGIARGAEMNAVARLTDECKRGVRAFLERD